MSCNDKDDPISFFYTNLGLSIKIAIYKSNKKILNIQYQ